MIALALSSSFVHRLYKKDGEVF